jgi:mono/diheme cytochrome c family protein
MICAGLPVALCIAAQGVKAAGPERDFTQGADAATLQLNAARHAASDLEVGGDLAGLPAGSTRYVALDALLALPLKSYTVTDDASFAGATKISGVPLEQLAGLLGAVPGADMLVAICDDKYRANYPPGYVAAHHPLLVLRVNGHPPSGWPKDPETHRYEMGPYMISHPKFTPSFRVLGNAEQAQRPWGVVRLEFRNEKVVLGAIAPRGAQARDRLIQAGYRIAEQNCFRCHNAGQQGGQKAGRPWLVLAAWASAAPDFFADYVRNPKNRNARAEMPANPEYDAATISALRDYFASFVSPEKP